jgi:G3E family GTPase
MDKTPVFVLTGFLGAGKSTLLNRLLSDPAFADTAVVINEFGDVALDQDLVRVNESRILRTTTGCLCCEADSDIRATLHEVHQAALGSGMSLSRVIVETTGLADPAPLVNQLIPALAFGPRDEIVASRFRLAGMVALFDIVTGELSLENHFEAAKQIAFADRIVLTKTDLAADPASIRDVERLKQVLAVLNPAAPIADSHAAGFDAAALLQPRSYMPETLGDDVAGWLALEEAIRSADGGHAPREAQAALPSRHGGRIRTFAITREAPVEPAALRRFLDLLAMAAGPRLLRAKGLVRDGSDPERPRVVHAVQHAVHPPLVLDAWPSQDRRTRLVFITDGIEPGPVRQLFEAALDNRPTRVRRVLTQLAAGLASSFRSGQRARPRFRPAEFQI